MKILCSRLTLNHQVIALFGANSISGASEECSHIHSSTVSRKLMQNVDLSSTLTVIARFCFQEHSNIAFLELNGITQGSLDTGTRGLELKMELASATNVVKTS